MPGPHSRDILSLLKAEAKKKPVIAEMMASVHGMSDAQIAALKVPLPWYRKALKLVRDLRIQEFDTMSITAALLKQTHLVYINDTGMGATRRWEDSDTFISVGKSGNSVELRTGHYVWFPERGGVWIDTIFSENIDPALVRCIFVERNKRSDYNRMVAERRRGVNLNIQGGEIGSSEPEQKHWFRIERI